MDAILRLDRVSSKGPTARANHYRPEELSEVDRANHRALARRSQIQTQHLLSAVEPTDPISAWRALGKNATLITRTACPIRPSQYPGHTGDV